MSHNQHEVNGRVYSFGTLPAVEAVHVEVAVAKVIGEPMFKAFIESRNTKSKEEMAAQLGASVIGMMATNMKADELLDLLERCFKHTTCDGKRIEFNAHFTGKNREMWTVFLAFLKFNFSDFFSADLFNSLRDKAKSL